MNKTFFLSTDASGTAISYILSQKDANGLEHPIAYGGRALRDLEKKWSISERECLALVEGVRQYRHFLEHNKFTVITDHAALKWLKDFKHSSGRLSRWSMLLQGFHYDVVHKAGKHHQNADALSRVEYNQQTACDSEWEVYEAKASNSGNAVNKTEHVYTISDQVQDNEQVISLLENRMSELKEKQRQCTDFNHIINYLESQKLPDNKKRAKQIVIESDQYAMLNGILYHIWDQRARKIPKDIRIKHQLAIPATLRKEILEACHDSSTGGGHQGFDRTYIAVRSKYYWPKMYAQIHQYVQSCEPCQKAKQPTHHKKAPLHPMPQVGIFQRWHMDILGPLTPTAEKYQYILLCVDSFSRYMEAFPLKSQEAKEIADVLYREIICRYGAPESLVSDRGKNFMSHIVSELCKRMNIKRYHTSAYHPETNSACERFNRSLAQSMRTYIDAAQQNWADVLPGILMAYRKTNCTNSTGYSPFELMFGQEMRAPIDIQFQPDHNKKHSADTSTYLEKLQQRLDITRKIAAENITKAQDRSKTAYDKNTQIPQFSLGDQVWLYNPKIPQGKSAKFHCKWTGPYYVTDLGPNHTYQLNHSKTNKKHSSLVHANRLKPYQDPVLMDEILPSQENNEPEDIDENNQEQTDQSLEDKEDNSTPPASQPNNEQWGIVEKLLKCSYHNGRKVYKVKWEGQKNTTWELAENLPAFLIREFHISKTQAGKARKRQQRH